ncbi:hypothetical protein NDU88_003335 [Pleurodeles waltl]|uniref:Uncharacterized protein n=1 Tax=Pleurodeles waltl TaxID=8319 RepID=A0AAV7NHU3_PLEWA|nr:hypothetical protein NDU88_003335 [Pleurodeles waltl]
MTRLVHASVLSREKHGAGRALPLVGSAEEAFPERRELLDLGSRIGAPLGFHIITKKQEIVAVVKMGIRCRESVLNKDM